MTKTYSYTKSRISISIKEYSFAKRFIRFKSSLVYVEVTRGFQKCFIYDGMKPGGFWNIEGIAKTLDTQQSIKYLNTVEITFSDEDWLPQGSSYYS